MALKLCISRNVVADALSRLPKQGDIVEDVEDFRNRIYIPQELRRQVLSWYHHYLCHPGATRMYKTIGATMYCESMESDIKAFTKACPTCQRHKKKRKKYSKLPPKQVDLIPWECVCIDLVGPYTVPDKTGCDRVLQAMTFIYPATGWFEITEIPEKSRARISQIFNSTRLARYPRPQKIIFDNGNEFKKDFSPLLKDFAIKLTPTTIKPHRLMPYWKGTIKSLVTCYILRIYKSMTLMKQAHGVSYWYQ